MPPLLAARSSTPMSERNWISCSALMSPAVKRLRVPLTARFSSARALGRRVEGN